MLTRASVILHISTYLIKLQKQYNGQLLLNLYADHLEQLPESAFRTKHNNENVQCLIVSIRERKGMEQIFQDIELIVNTYVFDFIEEFEKRNKGKHVDESNLCRNILHVLDPQLNFVR